MSTGGVSIPLWGKSNYIVFGIDVIPFEHGFEFVIILPQNYCTIKQHKVVKSSTPELTKYTEHNVTTAHAETATKSISSMPFELDKNLYGNELTQQTLPQHTISC